MGNRRVVLIVIGIVGVVLVILSTVSFGDGSKEAESSSENDLISDSFPVSPPSDQTSETTKTQSSNKPEISIDHRELEYERMFGICGVNFSLWSDRCRDELDAHFMPQLTSDSMITLSSQPTWNDIFENPRETEQSTKQTLSDATCLLTRGTIEPSIAQRCNSTDLVRYGTLKLECAHILERNNFLGVDEHGYPYNEYSGSYSSWAEEQFTQLPDYDDQERANQSRKNLIRMLLERGW